MVSNIVPISMKVAPLDLHQQHMAHLAALPNHPVPLSPSQLHALHLKNQGLPSDNVNAYLTNDPTYQNQMTAINKALGDYQGNELNQQNQYNASYALNRNDLQQRQNLDNVNQQEDYASRGMVRSGLYAQDNAQLLNNYARQFAQQDTDRQNYMGNLQMNMGNYNSSQLLAQQQARQDAINRHALSLIGTVR